MKPAAPYAELVWKRITDCADKVEGVLQRAAVTLTMGGEPTFVPLRPAAAEWQTAALGPTKLAYARRFAHRLLRTACQGGVILETIGKHYPGEPTPRWALLVQRRRDGRPLWRDPRLLGGVPPRRRHRLQEAERFVRALATTLALPPSRARPFAERREPSRVTGYVLPLDAGEGPGVRWATDDWTRVFGRRPVPLVPGESSSGVRLPLDRLSERNVRRALTVEIVHGSLTVFIPPLLLDPYLALVAAIEDTLAGVKLRGVILAGYAPPDDWSLPTVGLASDPGVLEINLAPCLTWRDYDQQLADVYAAAASCGLCARKFQCDGREIGTGGGAHLVFGGLTPGSSPFFSSPALLPSILRYWQHHPALSYAFTGAYVGPSSQAPRIDESTHDALYELEIACAGAVRHGRAEDPGLLNRLFRDLLTDRTGNTHRAEISVDKLWNPFASNGCLGLVELRAFETHPSRELQSTTACFIRAIVARIAADPFSRPFRRWGDALHDRFFLPAFVWEDLSAICADLRRHGLPFDADWLRPHWEWRFPLLGQFALSHPRVGEFTVEFRQALEAWPLLGESPDGLTLTRRVDSSLDRIEVRVSDARALRDGMLLVNGLPCTFRPASGSGAVAGIRYRAFHLPPTLQPHVPVHAPLRFEWIDRGTRKVVSAARLHVGAPNGTQSARAPGTPAEAAERRARRWEVCRHGDRPVHLLPQTRSPKGGGYTLDLRLHPSHSLEARRGVR